MKTIVYCAKWKRTTMQKVLVKHVTDVQKPRLKVRQVAMHVFRASTKLQRASIVPLDNSRTILIKQVVLTVQLDITRKIFLKLIMSKESVTTDVLDVLVASMVLVKNRLTKQQVVLIVLPVDFQI
jgi:hypothetical protein